jgi:hypothetical protein
MVDTLFIFPISSVSSEVMVLYVVFAFEVPHHLRGIGVVDDDDEMAVVAFDEGGVFDVPLEVFPDKGEHVGH